MKQHLIFPFLLILFIVACTKTELVPNQPKFEITIIDESNIPVSNTEVLLFETQENWKELRDPILNEITDVDGIVLFEELDEKVYFFYTSMNSRDNYSSISYFEEPLKTNHITKITTIIR